jgi:DNA-binding CsgD family transcriptional regulator/tetratricopeptide (TPR) repeat protein
MVVDEGPGLRGRARELSELFDGFGAAVGGHAGAVLIGGDAGVGKTSLVGALMRHARQKDAVVLAGTAIDIADAPPFWPVLSALRSAVRSRPDDEIGALLSQWLERLPSTRGDGPPVRLLDVLHQMIMDVAERRPVLLVIEDLQWADRSTRDLLAYLVAILTDEPVLVVATYRSDSPGRTADLAVALAELRRHQKVRAVELAPLPREVVAELVAEWAPGRPELEELVWLRSAGNAFIAEETVRAVLGGDTSGLPTTLREVVLSRIAVLSPAGQQVVRAIAASVGPLRHQLLAAVVDLHPAALLDAIRAAVAQGVVVVDESGDGYRLRHGLMTEVVAGDLLPGERIDLHRRFALALAASAESTQPGLAAQLAHHWYEAGDAEQALVATVAAAWASEGVHAHTEAQRHWLRAAELRPRVAGDAVLVGYAECLDRAARAAELGGDHDEAVRLLDRLLTDPDAPEGMAAALLHARKGSALAAAGRVTDAAASYRSAAALLPAATGGEAERAQVLAAHSAALLHALEFAGARKVALQALALARTAGARTVEARILAVLGFSLAYLENTKDGADALDQALAVAESAGEPEAIGEAHLRRAELLAGPLNQLDEGIAYARKGVERMKSLGLARTAGVALLTYAANALFRLGRWEEAQRAVADAWKLRPSGAAALDVRLARCRIDLGRGRLDAAAADLEAVELLARSTTGPRQRIPLLVLFSALALWRREPETALQHVEDGLSVAEAGADDIWAVAPLVWHGTRAWADLATTGRARPSQAQTDRLRHHNAELHRRGSGTVPAVRGLIEAFNHMCTAEIDRAGQATDPDVWEGVADTWERYRHPYPAAYARMRQAEALLIRRPRSTSAADALRRADDMARALGAGPLLEDIADLAGRARITLEMPAPEAPPPPPGVLDVLTARELEVLHQVADGLTNREIGQRLYISEKTVSVHVARIFTKIGVHSRVQASAVLHRSIRTP